MSKMPVDVRKLLEAVADAGQERSVPVYVDLVFDATASERLVDCMLDAFSSEREEAAVECAVLETTVPEVSVPADLCVIVGGDSPLLGDVASAARAKGIPSVVVIERGATFFSDDPRGARELARMTFEDSARACAAGVAAPAVGRGIPLSDIVDIDLSHPDARPLEELGAWVVANAPAKRVSMAAAFPFLRHPLAVELGRQNAVQNGAIGVVFFVPGADMPLITLNQVRMVVQIAAVYGYPLGSARMKEVAAVVAGAFGFRALARRLAGRVPVLGWAIRPAVAAAGTIAICRAAIDYFEEGGVLNGAAQAADDALASVSDAVEGAIEKLRDPSSVAR